MSVFISHGFEDKAHWSNIVYALKAEGIPHWDPAFMQAGTLLADQLRMAILQSEICVFIATQNSVKSAWCGAEVGAFWAAGKPVIIYRADPTLKENQLPKQYTGHLFTDEMAKVVQGVRGHLLPPDNFGEAIPDGDTLVLFLSTGGTCRCAMANAITRHYLGDVPGLLPMSSGIVEPSLPFMTEVAQKVTAKRLEEISGRPLALDLSKHRSQQATGALYRRANLILPFEKRLISIIAQIDPPSAVRAKEFSVFLGHKDDVSDPWKRDRQAYEYSFQEIHDHIVGGRDAFRALAARY